MATRKKPAARKKAAKVVKKSGSRVYPNQKRPEYPLFNGWQAGKNGYMTVFCFPYKGSRKVDNKEGKVYVTYMAEIKKGTDKTLYTALYDVEKNRVVITDLNLVVSPNGGHGGYFGTFLKRNYENN